MASSLSRRTGRSLLLRVTSSTSSTSTSSISGLPASSSATPTPPHAHRRALSSSSSSSSSPPPPPTNPNNNDSSSSSSGSTTHFGFKQVPVDEKEKLVKGVFNSVASKYDVMNDLMSGGMHRLWKDDFVRMAGLPAVLRTNAGGSGIRLLDVAGGTGDIAFRLMKKALETYPPPHSTPPPSITICDINAEMLKVGQVRAKEQIFPNLPQVHSNLEWVEGNAEELPFPDDSFDLYTIAFGLRNVTRREKALREAFRVLKKGGRFMCLEFSHVSLPVAKEAYDLYSFEVIPRLGQAVTGDAESYRYLVESIRQFPRQEELVKEIEQAGFQSVTYVNFTLGSVAAHSGFKWA